MGQMEVLSRSFPISFDEDVLDFFSACVLGRSSDVHSIHWARLKHSTDWLEKDTTQIHMQELLCLRFVLSRVLL